MTNAHAPTHIAHARRRLAGTLLLCTLPLAIALNGCKKKAPAEDEKPQVTVQAVHPQMGPISADIVGDATLAPVAQAAIASKINAPITKFFVQRGSHVKAGQLVAKLESRDLAAAAIDNQGSFTAAKGTFDETTRAQVPQEETQARLDQQQAKATLDLDQNILNARSQLFAQGAIPGRDVDTARATVQQAQAAYAISAQKYQSMQQVTHQASLETAQGQLTSAKGKYLGAEAQLSYTSLRTPISGVVTERPLFAGETAAAGTPIVTIMDTSHLIAKVHLAQSDTQQLVIGAPATLQVPGIDEPVSATVSLISPATDPGSTTIEVWLVAANPKGALRSGTAVHALIKGRTVKSAMLIPTAAVQRSAEGEGKMVIVVGADGLAHKKPITVGIQSGDSTQVLSGLTESDNVITTGGYGLDDGTRVKIAAPGAKPDADPAKPAAGGDKD